MTCVLTQYRSVWQKDYWQKQGAVDVWMKFYERGHTRPELEKEFFAQIDNPLLGKAFKLAIVAEWLAANSLDQGSYTPTNSELLEFWVSKRDPDRLLACQHAVVDYEIEGAKVKTNVLFEAATTANSVKITLQYLSMERELRLKAFIEEYARVVQLFDDIVSMKESMGRLETYMVVMVCQVGVAMI
ncbi:hypothetical protein TELCIR_11277, partial [Teladorsagia circumcincta]